MYFWNFKNIEYEREDTFLFILLYGGGSYRAQNEAYKEMDGEKRRKALPVKELCVMAASGRAKRNVYIGLHDV